MSVIYVERDIEDHAGVHNTSNKYPKRPIVTIDHYGEIFNRKNQNFRLQKQDPALILARKTGKKVLATPEGFGIGGQQNYYFSHMLNCLYDCRYCFLQGMYPSAHHLIFVNHEDFMKEIVDTLQQHDESCYFFSGYDCDSLAMEPVTGFLKQFLPFFKKHSRAILECRTKSSNIREFLQHEPFDNAVIAFSFTPQEIAQQVEHKTAAISKRIQALHTLADAGWKVGLRFDPLIYSEYFAQYYNELLAAIFENLDINAIHSVSTGPLRFPEKMYKKIVKLYPTDKLMAEPLARRGKTISYSEQKEDDMQQFVLKALSHYVPKSLLFQCYAL